MPQECRLKPCWACKGPKERGERRRLCNACLNKCRGCGVSKEDNLSVSWRKRLCGLCESAAICQSQTYKKYGITEAQYQDMVIVQCGTCAVCGEPETKTRRATGRTDRLAVHHSHRTGEVIALVCGECNLGMGKLKDNTQFLRNAADLNEGF